MGNSGKYTRNACIFLDTNMEKLRNEIKTWEKRFYKKHGHKPEKSDIKCDESIYKKYKEYWAKDKQRNEASATPVKKTAAQATTPQHAVVQSELAATPHEIGPTPQNSGKVKGMFDGIEFATPPRRGCRVGDASSSLITPSTQGSIRNKQGNASLLVKNTPKYLDFSTINLGINNSDCSDTDNDDDVISPLKQRSYMRSASQVVKDLASIKHEMSKIDFSQYGDDADETESVDQDENSDDDDQQQHQHREPRKFTVKRQTRRVHLRPVTANGAGAEGGSPSPKRSTLTKKPQPANFQRLKLKASGYKTNRNKVYKKRWM